MRVMGQQRQPFVNMQSVIEVVALIVVLAMLFLWPLLIVIGVVDEYKNRKRREQMRARMAMKWVLCRFELNR